MNDQVSSVRAMQVEDHVLSPPTNILNYSALHSMWLDGELGVTHFQRTNAMAPHPTGHILGSDLDLG